MEKIWIKKELYFEKYEFLKFSPFSEIYLNFKMIFRWISLLKSRKKGGIFVHRPPTDDMAALPDVAIGPRRLADVACGTTAPLRRGTEATWQDACGPRGARVWRWRVAGRHADAREGRHVARGGW